MFTFRLHAFACVCVCFVFCVYHSCRGDGAAGPGGAIPALDEDGGGPAVENSNGSTARAEAGAASAAAAGKRARSAVGGGCSLAHASRCLHNVLYLCAARAQVREEPKGRWSTGGYFCGLFRRIYRGAEV